MNEIKIRGEKDNKQILCYYPIKHFPPSLYMHLCGYILHLPFSFVHMPTESVPNVIVLTFK